MPAHRVPTETKKARGTVRPDRANPNEPKYAPGEPPMPVTISPAARAVWAEVVPLLLKQKLLAPVDGGVLESYCQAHAMHRACVVRLAALQKLPEDKYGIDETGCYLADSGLYKEHPVVKAMREWGAQVLNFGRQLGLTPASRAAVSPVPTPDDEDDLAKLMREAAEAAN